MLYIHFDNLNQKGIKVNSLSQIINYYKNYTIENLYFKYHINNLFIYYINFNKDLPLKKYLMGINKTISYFSKLKYQLGDLIYMDDVLVGVVNETRKSEKKEKENYTITLYKSLIFDSQHVLNITNFKNTEYEPAYMCLHDNKLVSLLLKEDGIDFYLDKINDEAYSWVYRDPLFKKLLTGSLSNDLYTEK